MARLLRLRRPTRLNVGISAAGRLNSAKALREGRVRFVAAAARAVPEGQSHRNTGTVRNAEDLACPWS
eukprot:5843358-Alexandrium_andersonii.AAC.1